MRLGLAVVVALTGAACRERAAAPPAAATDAARARPRPAEVAYLTLKVLGMT